MPELPEVQIQVDALQPLCGQVITGFQVCDRKLRLPARLKGQSIHAIRRRAKYIIFDLSSGDALLAHLRMTGWFEFVKPRRYRAALHTDNGSVYFADDRRFGVLTYLRPAALKQKLAGLGPEPLDAAFALEALSRTSRPVKVALLDQRLVAGVGNIYASESLWRAKINPRLSAKRLAREQLRRLNRGVQAALQKAIGYGPRIFEVQQFAVYDREGKACPRCRSIIRRMVQAQRSTFFCPRCQR